ncbi:hypothetical protein KUL42_17760 [Alteromonas sp. KUL42]|nr:hypothetical protein KUL42_17760 [Alteromonas sp. KUL42]
MSPAATFETLLLIVSVGAANTLSVVDTALIVVADPRVKLIVLVLCVYAPGAALAGTRTVTEKLHVASDAKLIFEKESVDVPDTVEPAPQNPVEGSEVADNPDKVAFKSLVKFKSVMSLPRSVFRISKSSVTDEPGDANEENTIDTSCNTTLRITGGTVGIVIGEKLPDS